MIDTSEKKAGGFPTTSKNPKSMTIDDLGITAKNY
jgi:hypothetical protein